MRWCRDIVGQVGALEPGMQALSDAEVAARTTALRGRLESGEALDALLPEAFAAVREAAARTLGQRHYDTQVMGGALLHLGKVVEMRTGEGKTLAATLPAYLNALGGAGVHIGTANDYLARRDAAWMRPVYGFLGMDAGLVNGDDATAAGRAERRAAYGADVTYGITEEFCYDFLRDNLAYREDECVQRGRNFAIVDEADLILIDDARTVPQITVEVQQADLPYQKLAAIVARFRPAVHFSVRAGRRDVSLTDEGASEAEERLGVDNLYDSANLRLAHGLQKALEAAVLYQRDRDYIVAQDQVVPVDPVSGRLQASRDLGAGLMQAIQAKEGLAVRPQRRPLAVVTLHDYMKSYSRLAAMTGTAASDAASYDEIYKLDVVVVPTNRPVIRIDHLDVFYSTASAKLAGLADEAARRRESGQPILIGAGSIEEAAVISGLLTEREVAHEVLTAKNNEREAEVISAAAKLGAVTVIAKMAGRGVDIVLGGPDGSADEREQVADRGGLCVLGAERHLNRRLELHLRGRAGRLGDPGESKLFASYEDEATLGVLGAASAARNSKMIRGRGPMSGPIFTRIFDSGQARWAAAAARQVQDSLQFDAVLSAQQRQIYAERLRILTSADLTSQVKDAVAEVAKDVILSCVQEGGSPRQCKASLLELYPTNLNTAELGRAAAGSVPSGSAPGGSDRLAALVRTDALRAYGLREAAVGSAAMRRTERYVSLRIIDHHWGEHLQEMAALSEGIGLRALGGRSPLAEYRREAAELFAGMKRRIKRDTVRGVFVVKPHDIDAQRDPG